MSVILVTSEPWSSATAMLSGVGSGSVKVCTNEVRYLFSGDLSKFQWYTIVS